MRRGRVARTDSLSQSVFQTAPGYVLRIAGSSSQRRRLEFFLTGVRDTAEQAASAARSILTVFAEDRGRIEALGRPATSVLRVFEHFQLNPMTSIPSAAAKIGISAPTVAKSVEYLSRLGVVREKTGRQRHRIFVYDAYLAILNEGTESLR
jgi:Fic family protein